MNDINVRREIQNLRLQIAPLMETAQQTQAAVQALIATICAFIPAIQDRETVLTQLVEQVQRYRPSPDHVRMREIFDRIIEEIRLKLLEDGQSAGQSSPE